MNVNADFSTRAVVHAADTAWVPSPMAGVERRMLDRLSGSRRDRSGEPLARATSIVRYAPGSSFYGHTHDGGEEYLVLDGVFQDQYGDFPAGTYVRNPPTTSHAPFTDGGATIFVKLWQFEPQDREQISIDTTRAAATAVPDRPGVLEIPLFSAPAERVRMEIWEPDTRIELSAPGGLEVLVVDGTFDESGEAFAAGDWLRLPAGDALEAGVHAAGARVWIKSDHLAAHRMHRDRPRGARSRRSIHALRLRSTEQLRGGRSCSAG